MNSSVHSKLLVWLLAILGSGMFLLQASDGVEVRIKDVARDQGDRDNMLMGYGLVTGLNGQGDSDAVLTHQTISNLMRKFQITIDQTNVKSRNVAIVTVTATVKALAKNGSRMDVTVSSLADAKSLQGGTLLLTPLYGADGSVYAMAQGNLSIGGFQAGGSGGGSSSVVKNHPTSGSIPGGAILEREIATNYFPNGVLEINLFDEDFTSAVRMANAINEQVAPIAHAVSGYTVKVYVPEEFQAEDKQIEFLARVENVVFRPDTAARIVINEKTGTIVANSNIKIDSVAVTHGNLTVSIVNSLEVSQPNAFTGNGNTVEGPQASPGSGATVPVTVGSNVLYQNSDGQQVQVPVGQEPPPGYKVVMSPANVPPATAGGTQGGGVTLGAGAQTAVTNQQTTNVEEEKRNMVVFNNLPSVRDVAAALNAMGVTPRDMMAIFQTMKEAGALHAELILQGN